MSEATYPFAEFAMPPVHLPGHPDRWLSDLKGYTVHHWAVLSYLVYSARGDYVTRVRRDEIARRAGVCLAQVSRSIRWLRAALLIDVVPDRSSASGQAIHFLWRRPERRPEAVSGAVPESPTHATHKVPSVTPGHGGCDSQSPPNRKRIKPERKDVTSASQPPPPAPTAPGPDATPRHVFSPTGTGAGTPSAPPPDPGPALDPAPAQAPAAIDVSPGAIAAAVLEREAQILAHPGKGFGLLRSQLAREIEALNRGEVWPIMPPPEEPPAAAPYRGPAVAAFDPWRDPDVAIEGVEALILARDPGWVPAVQRLFRDPKPETADFLADGLKVGPARLAKIVRTAHAPASRKPRNLLAKLLKLAYRETSAGG